MRYIKILFLALFLSVSIYAKEVVNVNLDNIEISKLIELVSKIYHKNVLMPYTIRGKVKFISNSPIYKDKIYDILLDILATKGYTIVDGGSYLKVVRLSSIARENRKFLKPNESVKDVKTPITKQIVVKNIDVNVLASKIRPLMSLGARLITIKDNNTLLITDYPSNILKIEKVIRELEKNVEKVVEIVEVKNAKLQTIYSEISQIARDILDQRIVNQKVKLMMDKSLKSIILIGSKSAVSKLKKEIQKLDKPPKTPLEITKIVTLKNSEAKSVYATLTQIVAKRKYKDISLKPSISYNEEINGLILIGHPDIVKSLETIINELDKEKYQVYVQAKIVEISESKAKDIGMKYGLGGGATSGSTLFTFAGNFGASAIQLPSGVSLSNVIDTSSLKTNLAIGAAISFLQSNGASKTISEPTILCINNKESSIYVGKTKSFLTGQTTNANGTSVTYKREDVGLTLKVKPRVASNDKVTLQVKSILENVDKTDTEALATQPTTTKQEVSTEVIVKNGESIVIGGLLENKTSNQVTSLPLLGDIPVIGNLFKNRSNGLEQKDIVIILTPYIIEKSSSLSKLQKFISDIAKLQEIYNQAVFKAIKKKKEKEEKRDKPNFMPIDGIDE